MKFIYLCLIFTFFQSAFGVEFEEPQEIIVLTEVDEAKFDRFLSNKIKSYFFILLKRI
jgi:hypothetical protein